MDDTPVNAMDIVKRCREQQKQKKKKRPNTIHGIYVTNVKKNSSKKK